MINQFKFWSIFIACFILSFIILKFIWDRFMPFTSLTDIISIFILVFVNVPLSAFCAQKLSKVMK